MYMAFACCVNVYNGECAHEQQVEDANPNPVTYRAVYVSLNTNANPNRNPK